MRSLCITSTSDFAGKNLLLLGLGDRLKQDGYQIAYLKPLGNKPARSGRAIVDEDIMFFYQSLGLTEDISLSCPVVVTDMLIEKALVRKNSANFRKELHTKLQHAFNRLSDKNEVVLIKGLGRFYRGGIFGLTELSLVKEFNWFTIVIDKFTSLAETIDAFISAKRLLGNLLVGVVFNSVPPAWLTALRRKGVPLLASEDIDVLGIIPQLNILEAVSIGEVVQALGGELVSGKDKTDDRIERFCMGAMNVESALRYFRKERCKAVVTSGDRADIQLVALETPTKCLILTDNLYPSDIILSRAEELKVPVMVVRDDIVRAFEKIEGLTKHIGLATPSKVKDVIRAAQQNVNIKTIYKKIGLRK